MPGKRGNVRGAKSVCVCRNDVYGFKGKLGNKQKNIILCWKYGKIMRIKNTDLAFYVCNRSVERKRHGIRLTFGFSVL